MRKFSVRRVTFSARWALNESIEVLCVTRKVKKMATVNVDKMSLKDLVELEAKVSKAIAAARDRERTELKKKMAEMAETHGFSVGELFGGARSGRGAGKGKSVGAADKDSPNRLARATAPKPVEQVWSRRRREKSGEEFCSRCIT